VKNATGKQSYKNISNKRNRKIAENPPEGHITIVYKVRHNAVHCNM